MKAKKYANINPPSYGQPKNLASLTNVLFILCIHIYKGMKLVEWQLYLINCYFILRYRLKMLLYYRQTLYIQKYMYISICKYTQYSFSSAICNFTICCGTLFYRKKNYSPFFCAQIHRLFIYFAYMHQHFDARAFYYWGEFNVLQINFQKAFFHLFSSRFFFCIKINQFYVMQR